MKFKDIGKRITGISTPLFGISWNPENTERDRAREVIVFLEDRRVLYNPYEIEIPERCVDSVVQIRLFLTKKIGEVPQDSELSKSLRAMRAACRKYLDRNDFVLFGNPRKIPNRWELHSFIGELRGVFGVHVVKIAAAYGIDIEEDLASIIPGLDSDDDAITNGHSNLSVQAEKRKNDP